MKMTNPENNMAGDADNFGRSAKLKWSRLSDVQIESIQGDRTKLIEELEDTYGLEREDALKQVRSWESEASQSSPTMNRDVQSVSDRGQNQNANGQESERQQRRDNR